LFDDEVKLVEAGFDIDVPGAKGFVY